MVSANAWKMQASGNYEWNLTHIVKLFNLVIKYKSQIKTGFTNLEYTLKLKPK